MLRNPANRAGSRGMDGAIVTHGREIPAMRVVLCYAAYLMQYTCPRSLMNSSSPSA